MYLVSNLWNQISPPYTEPFWHVMSKKSFGTTILYGRAYLAVDGKAVSIEDMTHIPAWSRFTVLPTTRMIVREASGGWPLRSLYWVQSYDNSTAIATNQHVYVIREKPWTTWSSTRTQLDGIYLPVGPIWSGFVLNTLFYAMFLWLLVPGPFVLRRYIRRKRGLCVKCGYDLRGAEHEACPECGQECPSS